MAEKWQPFLATRERGRRVREDLEGELRALDPGNVLLVDFEGVEDITSSFADECIAKLLQDVGSGDYPERGLLLANAGEDVREGLESVLSRRKLAGVLLGALGEPEVVGDRAMLAETLDAALALREFSAVELGDKLGLSAQAANNPVKQLVATGAVLRERVVPEGGGKEFRYRVVVPEYAS